MVDQEIVPLRFNSQPMRSFQYTTVFFLLLLTIWYSFYSLMPARMEPDTIPETEFSAQRALIPVKEVSKEPHYIGSAAHTEVRQYLVNELGKLGLEAQLQDGFVYDDRQMDRPINIIAKIEGTSPANALLIFSHYDSALVPSYGASDAGSGVGTILESVRAYLASGAQPKNDIIIMFTDAEEVGLDGAKLFVREHDWAKDIAFSINFEARGSGGVGNMILETNQGNAELVKSYVEADVPYPVGSSLFYSVYKMLPNDTDSTVLREEGDIDGFFFAFIDDHFDYHTANDNYANLDRNSLQHQGSYLLPLLHHYGNADLSNLKSDTDYIYFSMPFIKMVVYPFSWIIPMLIIGFLIFIVLVFRGLKNGSLKLISVGRGTAIFFSALVLAILLGVFGWKLMLSIYPQYNEIQHGFKYNGHHYVAAFVLLSLALLFYLYRRFGKGVSVANLLVGPLFFWLMICTLLGLYLEGGAYFIVPVYFGLIGLFVLTRQQRPNPFLLWVLCVPAVFIFAPLIQFFPVGLGSDHVFISTLFTVLLFGLCLPLIGFFRLRKLLFVACLTGGIGFLIAAHSSSDFSETRQKPNSLIYYQDSDSGQSYWLTYDKDLDPWTSIYLGEDPGDASEVVGFATSNKYNIGYTFSNPAPDHTLEAPDIQKTLDTIMDGLQHTALRIAPGRDINQLCLFTDPTVSFSSLNLNGQEVPKDSIGRISSDARDGLLVRYLTSISDTLSMSYTIQSGTPLQLVLEEYSFDLMNHQTISVDPRPANTMTKPFVVTDAVVSKRTIDPRNLGELVSDTLSAIADE